MTREEQEKWLAEKMGEPGRKLDRGVSLLEIARALLDAGVTVPEPPAPRYYADGSAVCDRNLKHSVNGIAYFYDMHPLGCIAAARAYADQLNAAERGK